ncbi:MAG: hypothetical protein A2660_01980 [Candidatus Doudnabacteria bacterium RIFCSPHIGHO2_01_FULL_45_18]|uniref:orotidine-5'-phosphate decarboxylase n=1 Tax=Candidatus Doudnabacteria bacterium RIFCSPHIGHO2_01_FULL_45_18 TaxID=1817823 RepID=A0A1F5NSN2_9BACT|nr:MAG: hypothetical protein A2660_01980 [Candidatus Doudnabacteria bacterium RIFCSPHIGHO2_01_FULL_45_18]
MLINQARAWKYSNDSLKGENAMQPHERIFAAVDTNDIIKAQALVHALKGKVGGFKIGLEFITSQFVQLVSGEYAGDLLSALRSLFREIGPDLFWDGKFDDIPNTVAGASLGLGQNRTGGN